MGRWTVVQRGLCAVFTPLSSSAHSHCASCTLGSLREITTAIHYEATARHLLPKFSFISKDQFKISHP